MSASHNNIGGFMTNRFDSSLQYSNLTERTVQTMDRAFMASSLSTSTSTSIGQLNQIPYPWEQAFQPQTSSTNTQNEKKIADLDDKKVLQQQQQQQQQIFEKENVNNSNNNSEYDRDNNSLKITGKDKEIERENLNQIQHSNSKEQLSLQSHSLRLSSKPPTAPMSSKQPLKLSDKLRAQENKQILQ
ncbi:MAG: hypothetical protein EZS28_042453 [Streblomastix strix]|uniref:Uncharacterized protein n=1 Tax=Streblomastix strix TaxID=222440 RepID=A0A5J4TVV8_9EUKA|nr:MAG: hypothetical protein EZS28_042453 [Streblomastix strix]